MVDAGARTDDAARTHERFGGLIMPHMKSSVDACRFRLPLLLIERSANIAAFSQHERSRLLEPKQGVGARRSQGAERINERLCLLGGSNGTSSGN